MNVAVISPTPQAAAATRKTQILLVDDHPIFRRGIAGLLAEEPDFEICAEVGTAPGALDAMRTRRPDIVVLDISLRGTNGIELIKLMHAEQPRLPILMLTMHDESLF